MTAFQADGHAFSTTTQQSGIVSPHAVPRAITKVTAEVTPEHIIFPLPNGYVILQLINPIRIPGGMAERRRKSPKTSLAGSICT